MHVGDSASRSRAIGARDIELFTELTGDTNPVHYDAELAARSRFGGIVVQGGVTSGLLNALVAEDLPGPGSVFLSVDWRFRAPVRHRGWAGEPSLVGLAQRHDRRRGVAHMGGDSL